MSLTIALKTLAGTLALAALVCGLVAARYSMQAAGITPDTGWTPPGQPGPTEPVGFEAQQMDWTVATLAALHESGRHNRIAGRWTIAAVILGSAASITSLFLP